MRVVVHSFDLFSQISVLNMGIAVHAMQRLRTVQNEVDSEGDLTFIDEALAAIRRSAEGSSLVARALATELEDISGQIRGLIGDDDRRQSYTRRWRVKN